jgi:MoaA/NifB/PqqE/SkfB family radical SAM enzyme
MKYKEINALQRNINALRELLARPDRLRFAWYRFKWNYFPLLKLVPSFPLHVDIEVTDACNLRCIMCVHGAGNPLKTGFIDHEFAQDIIRQVASAGVYSIKLNWRGEPALYKELPDLIAHAKALGIREVQINTNGLPFTRESIQQVVKAGLDRVIFSVDGNSAETYERIRLGGRFQRLVDNIEYFINTRKRLKSITPFIRVQMVRMQSNQHEVEGLLARWRGKVDDIRISDVTDRGQGEHMCVGDQVAVSRRRCPQPWLRMVVSREGLVMPCCSDWYCRRVVGDAKQKSLQDIWHGKKMKHFRKAVWSKKLDDFEPCGSCFVKESYLWEKKEQSQQ